jgi:hypothetical protein
MLYIDSSGYLVKPYSRNNFVFIIDGLARKDESLVFTSRSKYCLHVFNANDRDS